MTNKQENQLSMAKSVQRVLNDNSSLISGIPAFQKAKTDLDAIITDIDAYTALQLQRITGSAKDKKAAATAAIDAGIALVGPAKSFAKASENNSLFEAFNYTASSLKNLRDNELLDTLALISTKLNDNVAGLADYGVAAEDITGFGELTLAYKKLITAPRAAITTKSAATKALSQIFGKLKPVLIRLDGLIAAQKKLNPDFYNTFKAARVIIDNAGPKAADAA